MKQEVKKNNENLTIKLSVPLKTHRYNPYDDTENDEMDNIVGIVAGDEVGFGHWIDRRYKGKADDVSVPFYLYQGSLDNFRKLCKDLNIAVVEYPVCAYCHKPIFGCFTSDERGSKCLDCENYDNEADKGGK